MEMAVRKKNNKHSAKNKNKKNCQGEGAIRAGCTSPRHAVKMSIY